VTEVSPLLAACDDRARADKARACARTQARARQLSIAKAVNAKVTAEFDAAMEKLGTLVKQHAGASA